MNYSRWHTSDGSGLVNCHLSGSYCYYEAEIIMLKKNKKMLTIILVLAGLICFYLFFKAIDFFEKI
jgi:hypothetical protein